MRPSPTRSIAGGFAGTAAMTLMMYFVAPMMGLNMDIAAMLAPMVGGSWMAGMIAHFVNGTIIFPLAYAFVLYGLLPGSPVVKGVVFGIVLWLLAQTVVMPMMGAGFFSANMGGMMAVMGSLGGHVLYGAILGAIGGAPEGTGETA